MKISRLNQKKEYAERTRDHRLALGKKYREENKEKIREGQKIAVERNKYHYKRYKRKWYEENYERISALSKKRYLENYSPKVKSCVICGDEYNTKDRRSGKTCSDDCSYLLFKKTMMKNYGWEPNKDRCKTCIVCGNEFDFVVPNEKTCSKECKNTLRNLAKRDWYYQNLESHVRTEIKSQLGTEPPADLVEEATALRLLKRALRD